MMRLLENVRKNKVLLLNKVSILLSLTINFVCIFLYGQYDGFLKGETYAFSVYSTSALMGSSHNFLNVENDFQIILNSYFFIFIVFVFISFSNFLITLFEKAGILRFINLFLLFVPVFEYWRIFRLKSLALAFSEFKRFELFRELITADIIGGIFIIILLTIQLATLYLEVYKRKAK